MTDSAMTDGLLAGQTALPEGKEMQDWPPRPWALAGLLALAGLVIHFVTDGYDDEPLSMAAAALAFFGALAFAFTVDRRRYIAPGIFAAIVGLAMFGLAWRVAAANSRAADEQFWFAAGVVAITLALPLFQSGFHKLRWSTPYRTVHFHVWTDAISAGGALVFVGLSWALLAILSSLFGLIEIDILSDLMRERWFGWMFSGAAFGAALGVLRNQLRILGILQWVVMLVLAILAIPFAAALVIFLLAMIFSGPDVLWNATDSATPILLACAVGAFVLANAVLRDGDADMTGNRVTRIAALVLAVAIFPLALFAAISMGTRIAQHGLSPERIWALIAIAVAVVYGVAYLAGVARGRLAGWRDKVRQANLHLAVLICGIAIILALPIFDFGALSTRNQLARLADGDVSVEDFDLAGLRWDFGDAGLAAVKRLAKSDNAELAKRAKVALAQDSRPYRYADESLDDADERLANLRMQFDDEALRERVELQVAGQHWTCRSVCVALDTGTQGGTEHRIALVQGSSVQYLFIDPDAPIENFEAGLAVERAMEQPEESTDVTENSQVEIREWTGRRIYVDGKPIGGPIE